jgi:hypothetical protein
VRKKIPLFIDGDIAERVQAQPRVAGRPGDGGHCSAAAVEYFLMSPR